jgi:hypothetical protein
MVYMQEILILVELAPYSSSCPVELICTLISSENVPLAYFAKITPVPDANNERSQNSAVKVGAIMVKSLDEPE